MMVIEEEDMTKKNLPQITAVDPKAAQTLTLLQHRMKLHGSEKTSQRCLK